MSVFSNVRILKNLEVLGTTTSVNSEQVNIKDRYTYNNSGYTSSDFKQSGIIFNNKVDNPDTNFDPLIVSIVNNTTVRINDPSGGTQLSNLDAGDYVQLSGFTDSSNNGLFVVVVVNPNTINTNEHYYDVGFRDTDDFGGLHATSLGNVNDPLTGTARLDRVNITYLQTNADGKMSINNCTNIGNVTTLDIGGDFIRNGDVGGQQGAGGITEGGLTLKGNNTKDIFDFSNGVIADTIADNGNGTSTITIAEDTGSIRSRIIGTYINIYSSTSNDGKYLVDSVNNTNPPTITVQGTLVEEQSGIVSVAIPIRPEQPFSVGIIIIDSSTSSIQINDISGGTEGILFPGQTIEIAENPSNNGFYKVISVDYGTNVIFVDGTLVDSGGGFVVIVDNNDRIEVDATGNPTRDSTFAAMSIADSAYSATAYPDRVAGLKVQGNVLIEPDSKLYTGGYLTGARKIDGVIANEADITTVEFLNAHPVQTRASIRKAEVDSSNGANGNVQLPDNLASVYIYNHTDGVKTVILPTPSANLDGQVTTIILGSALGNSVVVQTADDLNINTTTVNFDNDPSIKTATLNLLGEKLTLMCNNTLKTWFIL